MDIQIVSEGTNTMEQKLFSELRTLYSLNWGKSNVIRIRIRMRDLVEPDCIRYAVETT